ncbi:protein NLRC5-like, partial [Anneissia japonica]|uniref:protein NLRC5-like n=1 Tax=Anneissia japonica TaxID=1529436 RepID=UPI0014259276
MTRQKEVYQNVNRMTPAIWHKFHELDIADVFTELILLQSKKEDKGKQDKSTCTKKEGRPTSLTEALEVIKSTDSCKVLITGEGGMGKTTLLKYIAHQWATDDEHILADKLLFLINIREIKESKSFLEIIMNEINSKELIYRNNLSCDSFDLVERFLVTHDNEIIFLLDGYDELERNAKDPIDLFKKRELRKSMVVITSRPDNTADLIKYCDVHIEVKGFSQSNIKKYIQNYFHSISEIEIGNSLIKEFGLDSESKWYWGGNHKEAFELCSSPLLLLHICTIWEEKRVLPTYLTDLFKELICCILNQYLNRAGIKSVIANFERIPDQYISAILILGECMYIGLKENTLSIDKFVLSNMAKDKELLNLALALGFVYNDTPANPGKVKEMYTPPHKLISEALAGLYLSTEIQKVSLKVEYEEIRCNAYLNMTRVFAIGFLGADADKLLKPWLIIRASNYRSIVQCLGHVKKEHEDNILEKLDKHMSNDMKAHSEQMLESFRSLINDGIGISSMHLFKLMKRCSIEYDPYSLEAAAVSLIKMCRERRCQLVAHTLVLLQVIDQQHKPDYLLKYILKWENEECNLLSAEMKKNHFKYNLTSIGFHFPLSSAFLIHFLKYASNLDSLELSSYNIQYASHTLVTGTILNAVINDLDNANIKLELETLDISGNDLNDIDGTLLGKLFKIAPKLKLLNVTECRLSGGTLRSMITECQNSEDTLDHVLKHYRLVLKGNNLSDIDGTSVADLVRVNCLYRCYNYYDGGGDDDDGKATIFILSDYSLTFDNIEKLVESVGENITIDWYTINMSRINLSSVSGITLARLFKICPELNDIDMSNCSLSCRIVNEMMEECCRMNVVLKDKMLILTGNDFSDIDGKSLAELVRVVTCKVVRLSRFDHRSKIVFKWSDYSLTADNLEKLVESVGENITLNWQVTKLSTVNLSSISGKTLACLIKISPNLIHIDMSFCSLSSRIVNEMMEECCRMNVVLKDNMLSLKGNDLSDIDGTLLAELVRVVRKSCEVLKLSRFHHINMNVFEWRDYSLTADNLEKLVESVGENITLNWQVIKLSKINLSSISGKTLACLVKISPNLIRIDMSNCSLSGRIVNEMMEECCRMNVVLKDYMLSLKGNDLSDIDGTSLAELVRVICQFDLDYYYDYKSGIFSWSDYFLTAGNLEMLVESVGENITLNWEVINLSRINLSSISGKTLARLFKISPDLDNIDMSYCSLSGRIVNEMMEECCRMNVVLKD